MKGIEEEKGRNREGREGAREGKLMTYEAGKEKVRDVRQVQ